MVADLIDDATAFGGGQAAVLVASVLLVAALIAKEIVTAAPGPRGRAVGAILDVVLVPLLLVFGAIVAARLFLPAP